MNDTIKGVAEGMVKLLSRAQLLEAIGHMAGMLRESEQASGKPFDTSRYEVRGVKLGQNGTPVRDAIQVVFAGDTLSAVHTYRKITKRCALEPTQLQRVPSISAGQQGYIVNLVGEGDTLTRYRLVSECDV